jgi:serine/threonine protein kinase
MRRKTVAASIFLEKYVNKKKLGKGAFGDVFLVEDPSQQLFALKVIDKKKLEGDNEEMIEYLKGEVECMKKMNHKYLTKLHDFLKDDDYYYMVL